MKDSTVAAFAEARLSPECFADVETHVRDCPDCYDLLAAALSDARSSPTAVTKPLGKVVAMAPDATQARPTRMPTTVSRVLQAGAAVERYTILGLVGRGGMGEVYAAYDPSLDRRVALKMMHAGGPAHDERARERMLREAQAIAKVSHPNVVIVYEVGTLEKQIFIAMEFIAGDTLASWLKERQRPWREILEVYLHAARGLSAAHRAGLVHRDFKPQNVMVASDGTVRVMDFGLARHMDEARSDRPGTPGDRDSGMTDHSGALTNTGELLGTPLYMAPEQFASERIDARTDQFSFCVSLYWSLFGSHPFGGSGRTPSGTPEPSAARATEDKAPAWLRRVLDRGLSVDPADRWGSMDDLVAALAPPPSRRRQGLVAVTAAVVLCGLGLLGLRTIEGDRAVCLGGPDRMAGVWELSGRADRVGSRRRTVRAAILRSGVIDAEKIWDGVSTLFDRHATKWLATYRDACEATRLRGVQSEEAFDLRMECLTENLDSTRAVTDLLAEGTRDAVLNALQMVESLDDYERCSNVRQLRTAVQSPKDPKIRGEVSDLRRQIRVADALVAAGRSPEGAKLALELVRRAEVLGDCPLLAEALTVAGEGQVYRDQSVTLSMLEKAIVTAESCGADRVFARAATEVVFAYGIHDWKVAERTAALARAALERIGGDPLLEGWLANNVAAMLYRRNRLSEAMTELERSLRIKRTFLGADSLDVARGESNLALVLGKAGRLDEALALIERVLRNQHRWFPSQSQWLANSLETRSYILWRMGRWNEAEESASEVIRIVSQDAVFGLGVVGNATRTMGLIALERHRVPTAIDLLERALQIQRDGRESPFEIAETQFALAQALEKVGSERRRATRLANDALAVFSSATTFEDQREEIESWMAHRLLTTRAAARKRQARRPSSSLTFSPSPRSSLKTVNLPSRSSRLQIGLLLEGHMTTEWP